MGNYFRVLNCIIKFTTISKLANIFFVENSMYAFSYVSSFQTLYKTYEVIGSFPENIKKINTFQPVVLSPKLFFSNYKFQFNLILNF